MAMHEALQGVTKVRLSRYCIFIEGSKLESTVFHYFNDNFILPKYWTCFSDASNGCHGNLYNSIQPS